MAMAGKLGATIDTLPEGPAHAVLFGEDQARYLVTTGDAAKLLADAKAAGVPAVKLGTTGGDALTLPGGETISVTDLTTAHEGWFPAYMAQAAGH